MTNQLFVKMVLDFWHLKIKELDTLLEKISDEQLQKEVDADRTRLVKKMTGEKRSGSLTIPAQP